MAVDSKLSKEIGRQYDKALENFFDDVADAAENVATPMEVRDHLEFNYDLGEFWEEWYREGDDESWH